MTGLLIARKLSDSKVRGEWLWSLLAALSMLSIGLVASGGDASAAPGNSLEGYKSYDGITVSVAILCAYISGLWIDRAGSRAWNRCAGIVVSFAVCSVILSTGHANGHGRGGWVAFAAGIGYVAWKQKQAAKSVVILFVLGAASIVAYDTLPNFASLVDMTLSPADGSSPAGVDDGGRIGTWEHEAPKLVNAPLLGAGFYHRGAVPGLWLTGSHNFFIQMFLETGVVGGILVAAAFFLMWRQAGTPVARLMRTGSATRGALIAAIMGGMSGEFYYGGIGALVLFSMLAVLFSLPTSPVVNPAVGTRNLLLRLRVAVLKPLISVVMPLFNAANTVLVALASLQAQTYENWECVIVDDGSVDSSAQVVNTVRDARIHYLRLDRNRGRGYARQHGLEAARGRYITFLDADDWIYPNKFRQQVELLHAEPELAIVSTGMAITDSNDQLVGLRTPPPGGGSSLRPSRVLSCHRWHSRLR